MSFGYSYHVDAIGVSPDKLDNMELAYRFLEQLVILLDMTPMSAAYVIHGPRGRDNKELYPLKSGISGFIPLIESGVTLHACAPTKFITFDIYSCKKFDPKIVLDFIKEIYPFEKCKEQWLVRGDDYSEEEAIKKLEAENQL